MVLTLSEKIGAVSFAAASLIFYAVLAWVHTRSFGPTLRARAAALLALREPAILLDSARAVALLAWMRNTPDVAMATDYLQRGVAYTDPVGVFRWLNVLSVPPLAVPITVWIYRAALAFAIVGVMGRAASAVAAVLHALLWSLGYSTVGYSVHNHVVFMILLSLALAPEPYVPLAGYLRALRDRRPLAAVGSYASYVRFAAAFAIVTVYVQTGIEKVLHGSPRWFNGITLQGHLLRKNEWSLELARLPLGLIVALSLAAVLWETLFGLVLFYRRLRPLGVLSGWSFHTFVRHGMGVTPFAFMLSSVLFVFTPYEAWTWLAQRFSAKKRADREPVSEGARAAATAKATPPAPSSIRLLALLALLALQWLPMGLRRGVYPFLENAMFSTSLLRGDMITAEARIVVRSADGGERLVASSDAIAVHAITFTEQVFERYVSPYRDHTARFEGKGGDYCEGILRSITRRAEPRAVEMTIFFDYFRAGELDLQTDAVQTCRLDAAAPAGTMSGNR